MVPMIPSPSSSLKRSSPTEHRETPPPTRQRLGLRHHHQLRHTELSHKATVSISQDESLIQGFLSRSIGLALNAVGFDGADPVAAESFRAQAEEYMLHFLSTVRQSMVSCRRAQPIPQDFTRALSLHNLTVSSLIPHLQPPVSPSLSQQQLEISTEGVPLQPPLLPFLGPALSGAIEKGQSPYIPSHFPAFPSKHTYKATAEFTEREKDPRAVRERATEEGRLGEEALRKLIGAGKSGEGRHIGLGSGKSLSGSRLKGEEMWLKTLMAVSQNQKSPNNHLDIDVGGHEGAPPSEKHGSEPCAEKLELGTVVNWEKAYWRVGAVGRELGLRRKSKATGNADVLMKDGGPVMAP
ncbi:MAG: hypothetical protein M1830_000190 [Pleopsidium flavum]|nr:MAG: hypothetical protein M1830_000190 [Pleopsidium flavum]